MIIIASETSKHQFIFWKNIYLKQTHFFPKNLNGKNGKTLYTSNVLHFNKNTVLFSEK